MKPLVTTIYIFIMISLTVLFTASGMEAKFEIERAKSADYTAYLTAQNATLKAELEKQVEIIEGIQLKPLGEFEVTHYSYNSGTTKTGTKPNNLTVAVDPAVIPLGSLIYIEGYGWKVAEDTGGFGGRVIDVYLPDKAECIKRGRLEGVRVWVVD